MRNTSDDPRPGILRLIDAQHLYVWETAGTLVSQTYVSTATPNGIKITGVYTPPLHRGLGYGSRLVAAVADLLLTEGRSFVFLFTDLTNPTSNRLYHRLGFTPQGRAKHVILATHAPRPTPATP